MRSRTASTTATALDPGCRSTPSMTARLSLNQVAWRLFSTLSMTSAISCRRTGAPLRYATTTCLYSSAVRIAAVADNVTFWRGP